MAYLYKGKAYLKAKLAEKKKRVDLRYKYYEMKNHTWDFDISTPPQLRNWMGSLGWCAKAVDALADRLKFYQFDNDVFGFNEIFDKNNPDTFFDSSMLSALISSCCFVYIHEENDFPQLQVIDGGKATGIIDPTTGLLKEGYAVLETDEHDNVTIDAYFTSEYTEITDTVAKTVINIPNPAPYPLLVPIIYKPDAKRPFGHSRISRACMSIQGSAMRTVKRSEIAAEFYSYPQKWVTGLSEDAEISDKWHAAMSAMMTFTRDDEGHSPQVGAFPQQSMSPHNDQLEMFASLFAGETGLTPDDLGFLKSNPTSAESIKASHENLRLIARKAQSDFSSGFANVGYLAACVRDGQPYTRDTIVIEKAMWSPIFALDINQLGALGDALYKIQQSYPDAIDDNFVKLLLSSI